MKRKIKLTKRISRYFSLLLLAGFVVTLQGIAGAALPPVLEQLDNLTLTNGPADVALDQQGSIYIAETNENRVSIFSQSGHFTGKTLNITRPLCVAVDAGGRILVGSDSPGSVSVYSPSLNFLFKLGTGDGEFGKPMDIAINAAGQVYVVDNANNSISIYNTTATTGTKIGSIGTPGVADQQQPAGALWHPTSLAIDQNAGEIVVLDHQQFLDNSSEISIWVDGTRIQYFDLNGASLPGRSYSKYGYNKVSWGVYDISKGEMTRANQLTVDSQSRVYVTDSRNQFGYQYIMIYDNHDTFLGAINSANSPFDIPMGITIGQSDRLYVASLLTQKVEVFGVDDFTAFTTTPQAIEFTVIETDPAPPSQGVTVTNQGPASISITASSQDAWITATAPTGSLDSQNPAASVTIGVNPTGLTAGTYNGSVVVTSVEVGLAETIPVILVVQPKPLKVTGGPLDFEITSGTTAASQPLLVEKTVGQELSWKTSVDEAWIVLDKTIGATPSTVRVYVNSSDLDVGTYNGTITFAQLDDSYPVDVQVSLTITADPGGNGTPEDLGNFHWNKHWTISQLVTTETGIANDLLGVSGTSKKDALVVGKNGAIFHFDGKDWTELVSDTTNVLNSVWSGSEASASAVGAEELVLSYDGTDWTGTAPGGNSLQDIWGVDTTTFTVDEFGVILESGYNTDAALRTVWGNAADDVFVAGEAGAIFHYDGTDWTSMTSTTTEWLNGLWSSSATDVFAVGENGTVVHYDGAVWTAMDSGTTANLNGICGTSADDVYAVGDNSLILHYDGAAWTAMDSGATLVDEFGAEFKVDLNDIWCSDTGEIVAVGDSGTVILGKGKKFQLLQYIATMIANTNKAGNKKEEETK